MGKQHGPTIKDDATYEALREQGVSKQKAARIANARAKARAQHNAAADPGRKGAKQPPYERWTKERLYAKAKEVGIGGRSNMNKQALIDALRHG
jgi:hypothetical protein